MTKLMRQILADKQQGRKDLAALPIVEKIAHLERLRDRHQLIASSPLRTGVSASSRGSSKATSITRL